MLELFVVIGLLAVLMAISIPFLLSSVQASAVRAGAEELATVLNRARQLAIKENRSMCVKNVDTRVRYLVGGCGATAWTGAGTDSQGFIRLANNIEVSSGVTTGEVVFTYIGTAPISNATYTVTNPKGGTPLKVAVAPSGRVSITP